MTRLQPPPRQPEGSHHAPTGPEPASVDVRASNPVLSGAQIFNQAFQSITLGILISDLHRNTLTINPAFEAMSGYTQAEIQGRSCAILQGPGTSAATVAEIREALAAHETYQGEILNYRKDGTPFWNALSIHPVFDDNGRLTRFIGFQQDITARKAAQSQLLLTEQIFAQSREGLLVTDAQRNIVMVNKAFTSITGYTQSEVLGRNPRLLSSGRQSAAFYQSMWGSVQRNGNWQGEIWNRRRSGEVYLEWLTINVLRDATGNVTNYIATFNDITAERAAQDKIEWLAHFDPLTGLPNRELLRDRCTHDLSVAKREQTPVAVLALNMDGFKQINDTLGFAAGNKVIRKFSGRLSRAIRAHDTVARLQGDEFMLVLPAESVDGADLLCARLLGILAEPFGIDATEAATTVSVGVAMFPTDGGDCETLVRAAQVAMHHAKQDGGNRHRFYSADMFEATNTRHVLGAALRNAIQNDELMLHYQPFVDLQTGCIGGMEALLRWRHPELGAISPARFIPLAEQTGQIVPIGNWVLRQACRDLRAWRDRGLDTPPMSVNLSPLQFRDPALLDNVRSALTEHGIEPHQICLELTEGAVMDDVPRSEQLMRALKAIGFMLSLDDFGTGYSSLSYLQRFPFDKVKIDQSFVRDITSSTQEAVIAKVVISMAHGLGLRVIAEGVETETQCEFMRRNACDEIQGYFFSRPVPAAQMQALLLEDRRLPAHLVRERARTRTLLLVDDEPNVVAALRRLLRPDGYRILSAASGAEGLQLLATDPIDIIMSDQRMPGMSGVEFLRQAKALHPQTIRIVLSGHTELQSVTDAINEGAVYRFLTKPWDDAQLRGFIQQAFRHKELSDENEQLTLRVLANNQEMAAANRRLTQALEDKHLALMQGERHLDVLREALELFPQPVLALDDEGVIAFANSHADALLGAVGPLTGKPLVEALPALDGMLAHQMQGVVGMTTRAGRQSTVRWQAIGARGDARGRIVTLIATDAEEILQ